MRKIFYVVLAATFMSLSSVSVASAEVVTSESCLMKKADFTFCGYALFSTRKAVIQARIDGLKERIKLLQLDWKTYLLALKKNPDDATAREKLKLLRRELAATWHELGALYFSQYEYAEAFEAFNHAVELEPDNSEYKKDRDVALAKVKSGAKKDLPAEDSTPKFNGLG